MNGGFKKSKKCRRKIWNNRLSYIPKTDVVAIDLRFKQAWAELWNEWLMGFCISLIDLLSFGNFICTFLKCQRSVNTAQTCSRNYIQHKPLHFVINFLKIPLFIKKPIYTCSILSLTEISWKNTQPISWLRLCPSSSETILSAIWSFLLPTNATGTSICEKS